MPILMKGFLFFLLIIRTFHVSAEALNEVDLGKIYPKSWLKRQISIQTEGMSGYIDSYWSDISNSQWIFPNGDKRGWAEGWERFPYFFDGFIPLAVISENQEMLARAKKYVDFLMKVQNTSENDGWLGPIHPHGNLGKGNYPEYDPWPGYVILKGLVQYLSFNYTEELYQSIYRGIRKIDEVITKKGLQNYGWANYRMPDFIYVLMRYDEIKPDEGVKKLIDKYMKLGFDWEDFFENFSFFDKVKDPPDFMRVHGVNDAMCVKLGPLKYRHDQLERSRLLLDKWVNQILTKYHGTATGLFHGDELLAGKSPTQGSELCLVVEYMFSLEIGQRILGDVWIGDLLEKVTYNNLPSVIDFTMNTHQYVTLDNQVICKLTKDRVSNFTNVGSEGVLYGVAPDYGCCTANFHQGWPKFVSSLWAVGTTKIVSMIYAPSEVEFVIDDKQCHLEMVTDYPFGDGSVKIDVKHPTSFKSKYDICFRIPKWVKSDVDIFVNGKMEEVGKPNEIKCVSRTWKDKDSLNFVIPMELHLSEYSYHNSVSIFRGPLLLANPIPYEKKLVHLCPLPIDKHQCEDYYDWELLSIEGDWNYGLVIDKDDLEKSIEITLRNVSTFPFQDEYPAVVGKVKAKKIPSWILNEKLQIAEELPYSPVNDALDKKEEFLELVPLGNTHLRVSCFPFFDENMQNEFHTTLIN